MEVNIREALPSDLAPLAATMRQADQAECRALGLSPEEGLRDSYMNSLMAFTLEADGQPVGMFGIVGSIVEGRAVVWLLTGDACERAPVTFVKISRMVLGRLLELCPILENWIDARYTRSIEWARRLGAEIEPPEPKGAEGLPFCHVTFRRGDRPWVSARARELKAHLI